MMSALGHKQTYAAQQAMSALPPIATVKADLGKKACPLYPRKQTCALQCAMSAKGPEADIPRHSLDHLVGKQQERLGRREAECLGRLEIDDEFKFDWRLHRQVACLFTFENAINI